MLQITRVPLINSLPADIICDSFDLVVVQWNRETQTLRRAKSVLIAFAGGVGGVAKVPTPLFGGQLGLYIGNNPILGPQNRNQNMIRPVTGQPKVLRGRPTINCRWQFVLSQTIAGDLRTAVWLVNGHEQLAGLAAPVLCCGPAVRQLCELLLVVASRAAQ